MCPCSSRHFSSEFVLEVSPTTINLLQANSPSADSQKLGLYSLLTWLQRYSFKQERLKVSPLLSSSGLLSSNDIQ